jgi:hypothetical protein
MVNAMLLEIKPKTRNWMMMASAVVLLVGVVLNVCHIGKYGRDEALIEEVKNRVAEADGENIIEITPEEYTQWAKHAYYMRYGKISLNPNEQHIGQTYGSAPTNE